MKMKPTLLIALAATALSLCLTGSLKAQDELREELHRTIPLAAQGRITLENVSGAVKITAWDRNEVKLDAVKRAYSRERLEEAQINVNSNADSLDIRTKYPERTNNSYSKTDDRRNSFASVDYTLTIPRTARLEGIELVNGHLELTGLGGDVKASVVNGQVTARGLGGEAKLSIVNGRLDATFDRLDAAKSLSLGSVSGQLTLVIPSDSNAQLRANTVSGSITNDFGLPVRRGEYVGRDLAGTLGSGGPRIKLSNVSGAISIKRAADNRPLSPATNQLPEGSADDDDDGDDEGDGNSDMASEARRAARRAMRVATRDSARAQIEARQAVRAAQAERRNAAPEARAEAAREASQARQDAARVSREARLEAEQAVLAAQVDNAQARREALREAQQAVSVNRREIERAGRAAARDAREAAMRLREGVYENEELRLVERESKSFAVSGVPRITLNTFDGRISVRAWDKPEVSLTAIKRAGNEQALRGITVTATQQGETVSIQTGYDKTAARRTGDAVSTNASVTLELFVPRNSNIKAVSGDGRVELDGVTGGVTLQTEDGRIEVRNGGGQLTAKTGDGRIEVLNYNGDVNARTEDGRISLEGRFNQLAARTGEGSILLTLPSDANATIETDAEVVNGDGITVEENSGAGKKLQRIKIGRGGTVFRLQTSAGNVYLRRQ